MKLLQFVFFIALFSGSCHLGLTCDYSTFRQCIANIYIPDDCKSMISHISQCLVDSMCKFDTPGIEEQVHPKYQECAAYQGYNGSNFMSYSVPLILTVFIMNRFFMA